MTRGNIFVNLENKFRYKSEDEIVQTTVDSINELFEECFKWSFFDENPAILVFTAANIGISSHSGYLNAKEKKLADYIFEGVWEDSFEELYEELAKPVSNSKLELTEKICQQPQLYHLAMAYLNIILGFAYIDGVADDDVLGRLESIYFLPLMKSFAESGLEEVPTPKRRLQLSSLESRILRYFQENAEGGIPKSDVIDYFEDELSRDVEKALDYLVELGVLIGGDNFINSLYFYNDDEIEILETMEEDSYEDNPEDEDMSDDESRVEIWKEEIIKVLSQEGRKTYKQFLNRYDSKVDSENIMLAFQELVDEEEIKEIVLRGHTYYEFNWKKEIIKVLFQEGRKTYKQFLKRYDLSVDSENIMPAFQELIDEEEIKEIVSRGHTYYDINWKKEIIKVLSEQGRKTFKQFLKLYGSSVDQENILSSFQELTDEKIIREIASRGHTYYELNENDGDNSEDNLSVEKSQSGDFASDTSKKEERDIIQFNEGKEYRGKNYSFIIPDGFSIETNIPEPNNTEMLSRITGIPARELKRDFVVWKPREPYPEDWDYSEIKIMSGPMTSNTSICNPDDAYEKVRDNFIQMQSTMNLDSKVVYKKYCKNGVSGGYIRQKPVGEGYNYHCILGQNNAFQFRVLFNKSYSVSKMDSAVLAWMDTFNFFTNDNPPQATHTTTASNKVSKTETQISLTTSKSESVEEKKNKISQLIKDSFDEMTATEIAEEFGYTIPSTLGLLQSLVEENRVIKISDKKKTIYRFNPEGEKKYLLLQQANDYWRKNPGDKALVDKETQHLTQLINTGDRLTVLVGLNDTLEILHDILNGNLQNLNWVKSEVNKFGSLYESRKLYYYQILISKNKEDASLEELNRVLDELLIFGDYKDTKEQINICKSYIDAISKRQTARSKKKGIITFFSLLSKENDLEERKKRMSLGEKLKYNKMDADYKKAVDYLHHGNIGKVKAIVERFTDNFLLYNKNAKALKEMLPKINTGFVGAWKNNENGSMIYFTMDVQEGKVGCVWDIHPIVLKHIEGDSFFPYVEPNVLFYKSDRMEIRYEISGNTLSHYFLGFGESKKDTYSKTNDDYLMRI